jgi:hypothetical protein
MVILQTGWRLSQVKVAARCIEHPGRLRKEYLNVSYVYTVKAY